MNETHSDEDHHWDPALTLDLMSEPNANVTGNAMQQSLTVAPACSTPSSQNPQMTENEPSLHQSGDNPLSFTDSLHSSRTNVTTTVATADVNEGHTTQLSSVDNEERDPINAKPMTYEDYSKIYAQDLRHMCAERKLNLPKNTSKEARIRALMTDDMAKRNGRDGTPVKKSVRRTQHCLFRLLNVLFSDEFCEEFSHIGDPKTRENLDSNTSKGKTTFFENVAAAFQLERPEFGGLIANHEMFRDVDPSVIHHAYSGEKMEKMWKEVRRAYDSALVKFRQSGTHDMDFGNFVNGNAAALHLWEWLEVKPQMKDFVDCEMRPEAQYDSLVDDVSEYLQSPPSTQKKHSRQEYQSPASIQKRLAKKRQSPGEVYRESKKKRDADPIDKLARVTTDVLTQLTMKQKMELASDRAQMAMDNMSLLFTRLEQVRNQIGDAARKLTQVEDSLDAQSISTGKRAALEIQRTVFKGDIEELMEERDHILQDIKTAKVAREATARGTSREQDSN